MTFQATSLSIVDLVNGPMKIKGAEISSPLVDSMIKVRKPYTISKQREKWSEEEHHKFLEALKLYGRAWRCIEEHIGTKTTIQIRSHAQKFFSKMERESAIGRSSMIHGSSGEIDIPPPRPKRRSNHPYPRKGGVSHVSSQSIQDTKLPSIEVSEEITGSPETKLRLFGKSFVVPENEREYSPVSEVSMGTEKISTEVEEISSSVPECVISNSKSSVSDNYTELVQKSVTSYLDRDEGDQTSNTTNSASILMESQTLQQFPSHPYVPNLNSMMPFPMYWPYSFAQYPVLKDDDGGENGNDMKAFDPAATYAFVASAWQSIHCPSPSSNNNMNLLYNPTALIGTFGHQLGINTCNTRNSIGSNCDNTKCGIKRKNENDGEASSSERCFGIAMGERKLSSVDEAISEGPCTIKKPKSSGTDCDDGESVSDESVCKFKATSQSQVSAEADHSIEIHKASNNEEQARESESNEFGEEPIFPFSLMFHESGHGIARSAFTNIRTKAKGDSNQINSLLNSNSRPLACSRYSGAGFVPYKRPTLTM